MIPAFGNHICWSRFLGYKGIDHCRPSCASTINGYRRRSAPTHSPSPVRRLPSSASIPCAEIGQKRVLLERGHKKRTLNHLSQGNRALDWGPKCRTGTLRNGKPASGQMSLRRALASSRVGNIATLLVCRVGTSWHLSSLSRFNSRWGCAA